jgi:glycosyltransferase involved in cell wall biosynthesis
MIAARAPGRRRPNASSDPLAVLMVTPHYLPEIGGVERHVHEVATRLAADGVAVTVLTTDREGRLPALDQQGGVTIRRVRAYPRSADWLFAPGLSEVIAEGEWDLVHVQSYHTFVAPITMATAARHRVPYVVTFHGGGYSGGFRNRARVSQRALLRPLLARACALVAVAQFEIDEYARELRLPPGRFVLISNGVDLPLPEQPGVFTGPHRTGPLIASVGRLERYKGHQRVIAGFARLLLSQPSARLWIAGSGPYERELRELVTELGLGDRVEISAVAPDDREEMARRLAAVDLVVLMSDFETQPIAALEAIALGRPLLVARGSGLGELAQRGLARSIETDAPPEALAAAMESELREPLARPALALPTWDDCAAGLLALYERIIGARG